MDENSSLPQDPTVEVSGQSHVLTVSGQLNHQRTYTELRMQDGQVIRVPTAELARYALGAGGMQDAKAKGLRPASDADMADLAGIDAGEGMVIPLVEEMLTVGKRTVETGKVRLQVAVQEHQEALNEVLAVRTFDVERVVLNKPITGVPGVRQEGDVTVYPVIEEQLILTKQLVLKEEVRVTRRDTERRDTQVVTLRREHLTVEREPMKS